MADEGKKTYAVALVLSNKAADRLSKLRTDYQQLMDYMVIPHITLVYPFSPVFSLFQINEQLEKVARRHKPFNIILDRIGFFENGNNVFYAALNNNRTVKSLHMDIVKSLESFIQYWNIEADYNGDRFIPHVTIGARIPDFIFPDIKKRYSAYRLHLEETVRSFILFSEKKGIWERKRKYELTG